MFWFTATHEVEAIGLGGVRWRLVRMPGAGTVADQDAKLWSALEYMRTLANELLVADKPVDDSKGLRDWHDRTVARRER